MNEKSRQDAIVEFVNLVKKMRTAQKDYFHTRTKAALERSKQFEKEVDQAIQDYLYPQQKLI